MRGPDRKSGRAIGFFRGLSLRTQALHLTMFRTSATQAKGRPGCGEFTLVGPLSESQSPDFGYRRHLCNAYRCGRCRPRKLQHVRSQIGSVATARKLTRFVTLTLDPSKIPAGVPSHAYLRDCWRKMRVYLSRRLGRAVEFVAVLELHRSGIGHLHILVGVYLPQEWLSRAWQAVGGGRIVDIRWVDVHRVAGYLAKYLTKDSLGGLPPGTRLFSCSRGIVLWPKKKASGWWLCLRSIDELYGRARQAKGERWEDIENVGISVLIWFEAEFIPDAAYDSLVVRRRNAVHVDTGE